MADQNLKREFDYFLSHKDELLKQYENKYIVIKAEKVIGVYDSEIEAYEKAQKENELGTFLIQLVSKDENTYNQTFHSRVMLI